MPKRNNYLDKIDGLLDGKNAGTRSIELGIPERVDRLPRLLLHGETGVGKTLIARDLHQRSGFLGRPLRIPIPEYLGKEDMFEYDLFGYMRGAYTDAKEADHGDRDRGDHAEGALRIGGNYRRVRLGLADGRTGHGVAHDDKGFTIAVNIVADFEHAARSGLEHFHDSTFSFSGQTAADWWQVAWPMQ